MSHSKMAPSEHIIPILATVLELLNAVEYILKYKVSEYVFTCNFGVAENM